MNSLAFAAVRQAELSSTNVSGLSHIPMFSYFLSLPNTTPATSFLTRLNCITPAAELLSFKQNWSTLISDKSYSISDRFSGNSLLSVTSDSKLSSTGMYTNLHRFSTSFSRYFTVSSVSLVSPLNTISAR